MSIKTVDIERRISEALPANQRKILVAVSGGVDSVVLLHALTRLAGLHGLELQAVHLDHQIRPRSSEDAAFVEQLCAALEVPCWLERCPVPQLAQDQRLSLEMAGRQARRELFRSLAKRLNADLVALAHHRDDQVETLLLRLVRGTGQSGMVGMAPRKGLWWRPLLRCSRQQIVAYAKKHELSWVEDESNCDPAYLRNRLRHELVPLLKEFNPRFVERTESLIRQCRVEEDFWQQQVALTFPALVIGRANGLRLSRPGLLAQHPALQLRLLREALRQERGDLQQIENVHLEAVAALLSGARSQAQLDLPGAWVARRYETIWFRRVAPAPALAYNECLSVPGRVELPDGRVLQASVVTDPQGETAACAEFDLAELDLPLRVRSWHYGDRFEPQGMAGSKKLKRFFGDNHLELEERGKVPILLSGERILWLVGWRRSRHGVASPRNSGIARIELL